MNSNSKMEEAILRYLEKRKSSVTFNELYKALNYSEQGIRNRVYLMMDKGLIERLKRKSPRLHVRGGRPQSLFRIKPRSKKNVL